MIPDLIKPSMLCKEVIKNILLFVKTVEFMKQDYNFSGITREDIMKSCGEMMFNTDMFTNVKNEYEWVSEEGASIGLFSIDYF